MSSSYDAGYYADEAVKTKNTKCKASPNRKHKWKKFGSWPSSWEKCLHCKQTIYYK